MQVPGHLFGVRHREGDRQAADIREVWPIESSVCRASGRVFCEILGSARSAVVRSSPFPAGGPRAEVLR